MDLVGDDRPADACEVGERHRARRGHARPRLGQHAGGALAQHQVERQAAQLSRQTRRERAVAGSDLGERERRGSPHALPQLAQIDGQRAGQERCGDGRRRERAVSAEARAPGVEAALGVVERALHEGAEADRAGCRDPLAQARREVIHGVKVPIP